MIHPLFEAIQRTTALRHGYSKVVLSIIDMNGKGRGENKPFYAPYFLKMNP